MRSIALLLVALLCGSVAAQDFYSVDRPRNLGQAFGQGAIDAFALRKQVDSLQEEVRRLTGENEALRAQLRSTKQPEPTPAKKIPAKIVSAVRCESCPLIKKWLRPWLLNHGYSVIEVTHTEFIPGRIYPYVEFEVCTDTTCEIKRVMVPDTKTPFTQDWFEQQIQEIQLR